MIDGKIETAGYLNKAAPTWIEIDLAQPGPLAAVELITAQDQSSVTIHEIWVWTTDGQFRGMHTFVGPTSDGQTLTTRFDVVPNARSRADRHHPGDWQDRLARDPSVRPLSAGQRPDLARQALRWPTGASPAADAAHTGPATASIWRALAQRASIIRYDSDAFAAL